MAYFDDKQKRLIISWHKLSVQSEDAYMSFMAEWIAFNAICYNLYYKNAIIERANIDRSKSKLNRIHERFNPSANIEAQNAKLEGTLEKWSIDLSLPERLFISVSNNYTEDIIFNEFVKANQDWYNNNPPDLFDKLKKPLAKGDRHYVINMAKSSNYSQNNDIEVMAKKKYHNSV